MRIYIRSAAAISPQNTFGEVSLLKDIVTYTTNRLQVIEPSYKDILDPKLTRRMSRIIRMGTATAIQCLYNADITQPGAIITGTTYGCLEDTGTFLTRMIEQQEELLPPTAFIQSTHNTVGAQIALMLQCHAYNNTFVHNGFSFESALQDAIMLLAEGDTDDILVGSADELTDISFHILSRMGMYKRQQGSNLELFNTNTKGTIGGEGAAFFCLSTTPGKVAIELDGLDTFYIKGPQDIEKGIKDLLSVNNLSPSDIDLLVAGRNGDKHHDECYTSLENSIFQNVMTVNYKYLCGDYPTASSFGLWLSHEILKAGQVPIVLDRGRSDVRRILICNTYLQKYCSLMLVSVNQ